MKTTTLMFRPLDVLHLRGNRLFGGPGDHGEALMPPWPSVFSGAVASRAIADAGRLAEAGREGNGPAIVEELFGNLSARWTALADEKGQDRLFFPIPADLVVLKDGPDPVPIALSPISRDAFPGCASSLDSALPEIPALRSKTAGKPETGFWITLEGLKAHLAGEQVDENLLEKTEKLWKTDPRLGIAMDGGRRTAEKGRIYTSEAVALAPGVGFVCCFLHEKGDLPGDGIVRLGGDGRGAWISPWPDAPAEIGRPGGGWRRFRMILASPCPSGNGWLPPGLVERDGAFQLETEGLAARLVSAAVPRCVTISGWDLARHRPKPAERMIPAGSVYWFEVAVGDSAALSEIWEVGLLPDDEENEARRREGFGRVWFGKA